MDPVFYMYLWEEINTKFQMHPFHPPRSQQGTEVTLSGPNEVTLPCRVKGANSDGESPTGEH